ncbi:MAG: M3 family metallopeptidase [Prevotellaceae bacterium]|nr:M3 family metallopeptidase [Prevotellaceae bacterium]
MTIHSSCTQAERENPFLTVYKTEYGVPPFDKITIADYEPAFKAGMEEQNERIATIINNGNPTFDNVIVALDESSPILDRVQAVFFNLLDAETTPELTDLSMKIAPLLSEHADNIYLNAELFRKVDAIYTQRAELGLNGEQMRLLEETYKNFVRAGANLTDAKKATLREINKQLSTLTLAYSDNILKDNNAFQLFVENEADLSGLPEWFKQSAAAEAEAAGQQGKWLFTLHNASRIPLLQYADKRELREQVYNAYINRCNHDDADDNKQNLTNIVNLRLEKAKLLGFDCFSAFQLDNTMAKTPKSVMDFLNNLWSYALPKAKAEAAELQQLMDKEGKGKLAAWDWWYYTEKLRRAKYNLDEEEIKPYFRLENVRQGAFDVANKLYGITFTKLNDMPVYHPDVEVFRANDADGSFLGIFYVDYFPRAGKSGGAWMNNYQEQAGRTRPVIVNVCSFTKPVGDTPSLLTLDEVQTLFHEFGHALHGMLSQCTYKGIAGTNVARDFVELPSQVMEHWATEPEVLKMYARHYLTNEVMPDALIEKINKQATFNQGFMTTELLAAALLDMDLHNLTSTTDFEPIAFERTKMDELGLIPQIAPRYRVTYFNHIVGGYAAGYYSYLWANVLDADAFEAFKENGIFDKETADKFRRNVLEKGNSEDPMVLYVKFRGAEPNPDAMLRNRGMK